VRVAHVSPALIATAALKDAHCLGYGFSSSTEFEHLTRSQVVIQHISQHLHPMFKLLVGEIAHKPVSFVIQSGDDLAPL